VSFKKSPFQGFAGIIVTIPGDRTIMIMIINVKGAFFMAKIHLGISKFTSVD